MKNTSVVTRVSIRKYTVCVLQGQAIVERVREVSGKQKALDLARELCANNQFRRDLWEAKLENCAQDRKARRYTGQDLANCLARMPFA